MMRSVGLQCLTVPISSTIPEYMLILLLICFVLEIAYCLDHLYCCLRTFLASLHALFGLLLVFCTHHAKHDGNACAECNLLNTLSRCITDNYIVTRCSLHHTPKADQCIVATMGKHSLSHSCQFK